MPKSADNHVQLALLISFSGLLMFACQAAGGAAPETTAPGATESGAPEVVEVDLELGPGSFDYPDPAAGLDQLSSFKASLTVSFDGTEAGQPKQWSNTSVLASQKEPAARTLTFETTAEAQEPQPVFRAEMNGAAYKQEADGACTATPIDPANSEIEYMNPVIALTGVLGAEDAGQETVNGIEAGHYTFDERAIVQAGLNKSSGELWVASEGGYLVRYHLTTTGDEKYFGEGITGTYTWNYELSEVNQSTSIQLPEGCPLGMVDAPLLDDASGIMNMPGLLQYDTAVSVAEALAFYEQKLPELGWAIPAPSEAQLPEGALPEGMSAEEYQQALEALEAMGMGPPPGQPAQPSEPTSAPDPNEAFVSFERGSVELVVWITRGETSTQVRLALRDSPE